jgi:hypothetical protein
MARRRIGELLLERGVISRDQLEAALMIQKHTRERLGITLISQGFLTEDTLVATLSDALAVPRVELERVTPDWAAVHLLRPRFCELNALFPYALEKDGAVKKGLVVAMADPLDSAAVQQIEFTTGLPVSRQIATSSEVRRAILRWHYKVDPHLKPSPRTGGAAAAPDSTPAPSSEPAVIVGRELPPADPFAESHELAQLIEQRTAASARKKTGVASDLEYLYPEQVQATDVEKLERKFWALVQILARKGLITKDEFREQLDEDA